jgi:hypothetical protein
MRTYNVHKPSYGFGDRKMLSQVTIRIDPEIKKRFSKPVRAEGKTPGQVLSHLIENYIKQRDTRTYIDDLWTRIEGKLRSKDLKQREMNRVIKEARKAADKRENGDFPDGNTLFAPWNHSQLLLLLHRSQRFLHRRKVSLKGHTRPRLTAKPDVSRTLRSSTVLDEDIILLHQKKG